MTTTQLAASLVHRLFEDEHYLVVNKPAGLALGGRKRSDAAGLAAIQRLHDCEALHPVYPLGRHLSGIQPLAKNVEAAEKLARALGSRKSTLAYAAVLNDVPKRSRPRGKRPKSEQQDLLFTVERRRHGRVVISFEHPATRTAELRAALRVARMPVLGEPKASDSGRPRPPKSRLFLHRSTINLAHPYTREPLGITAPLPDAFHAALTASDLLEDMLEVALASRIGCLADPHTNAFRLCSGKYDGIPGLYVDLYDRVALVQTYPGKFQGDEDRTRRIAKWYASSVGARSVYHKRFVRGRGSAGAGGDELRSPTPMHGRPGPEEVPIEENGLTFLIRPCDGFATGLFLDQRENRRRVWEYASEKRVLNAFAYTCGFSVAAAAGGAAQVVSVDISIKALEWGRRNFEANGIDQEPHLFFRSEVFQYLRRAERQGQSFDLIILDAPTFARNKRPNRTFSIKQDLRALIRSAADVLASSGQVLISTNHREASIAWLKEQVALAAADAHRPFKVTATPALPADFAADPDHSKSIWAGFG